MARSVINSPNAFVSEVARFLGVHPADVRRMIEMHDIPAITIPQPKGPVYRIPLRDLHEWYRGRRKGPALVSDRYETFLADFNLSARASSTQIETAP